MYEIRSDIALRLSLHIGASILIFKSCYWLLNVYIIDVLSSFTFEAGLLSFFLVVCSLCYIGINQLAYLYSHYLAAIIIIIVVFLYYM